MFFLVANTVWAAIVIYLAVRIIPHSGLPKRIKRLAWSFASLAILALPAAFALHIGGALSEGAFLWAAFTLVGFTLTLFPLMVARDLFFLPLNIRERLARSDGDDDFDPARRMFLARSVNLSLVGLSGGLTGWGAATASRGPLPKVVEVPLPNLPPSLDGFSIVQITDTHFGPSVRRDYTRRIVDLAMDFSPDLLVHTGDFADGLPDELAEVVAPLAELSAPYGKWFVTGNHEYYWDLFGWLDAIRGLGFTTLVNEHAVVDAPGGRIVLAGVTDYTAGQNYPPHIPDPAAALAGAPGRRDLTLFLAHQPKNGLAVAQAGADFCLFGHTHGGQFFPWTLLVPSLHPIGPGLSVYEGMAAYVSAGTAFWGPPLRTLNPPEVTKLVLRSPRRG